MKKKLKEVFDYFILQVFIPNIVWTALGLLGVSIIGIVDTIKALYGYLFNEAIVSRESIIALIAIVICILGGITSVVSIRRLSKKTSPIVESTYTITDSEFELFFETREKIVNRQTIFFTVTASKLDKISHTFVWTGSSFTSCDLDSDSKQRGYRLKEERKSSGIYVYSVLFPETYKFEEKGNYTLEAKVEDANHSMLPFLSRSIKCQTDKLNLKVTAPIGMIKKCEYYVSVDSAGEMQLTEIEKIKRELVGNNECYRKQVLDLDMLRYYRLSWEFSN